MKLVGFLRGINVGGHHKVPMAELRKTFTELEFMNVRTLLNSGNIVFTAQQADIPSLETKIEETLSQEFQFSLSLILRPKSDITTLVESNPFETVQTNKDLRLYVSFLKDKPEKKMPLPYSSPDNSFQILSVDNGIVCSVLDLSITRSPRGMENLEKLFGKNITTRNWNTVLKINAL